MEQNIEIKLNVPSGGDNLQIEKVFLDEVNQKLIVISNYTPGMYMGIAAETVEKDAVRINTDTATTLPVEHLLYVTVCDKMNEFLRARAETLNVSFDEHVEEFLENVGEYISEMNNELKIIRAYEIPNYQENLIDIEFNRNEPNIRRYAGSIPSFFSTVEQSSTAVMENITVARP